MPACHVPSNNLLLPPILLHGQALPLPPGRHGQYITRYASARWRTSHFLSTLPQAPISADLHCSTSAICQLVIYDEELAFRPASSQARPLWMQSYILIAGIAGSSCKACTVLLSRSMRHCKQSAGCHFAFQYSDAAAADTAFGPSCPRLPWGK